MRVKRLILSLIVVLIGTLAPVANVGASTQDFYFEDFTADYYLTKDESGVSNLHVKEVLTAVFPETNQNHGINREIYYLNQGGKNRTVASEKALNLVVLRNGEPEPVNKIVNEGNYYNVYIGNANEYVHGRQVYTLEYDFHNVITEFDSLGNNVSGEDGVEKVLQELYWNTNGTGWKQRFDKLTARLHVPREISKNMSKDGRCYVGRYGESGSSRCVILQTEDGFSFETSNLSIGENLTFAVRFKPDTFVVVIEKSYILVIVLLAEIIIASLVIIKKYRKWQNNTRAKSQLYKSLFTAPQYQPPKNKAINVAEGERICLINTKTSYVATLLELAVAKKITITKIEDEKKRKKKNNWSIHLNVDPESLSGSQRNMLNILFGEEGLTKGADIEIKKRTATKYLVNCAKDYREDATDVLVREGYWTEGKNKNVNIKGGGVVSTIIAKLFLWIMFPLGIYAMLEDSFERVALIGAKVIVGGWALAIVIIIILVVAIVIGTILGEQNRRFERFTDEGIKLAKYLEGLELYIKMAEKDRLKFLQSVEGADTSDAGIVKLYEKLLPWASLFGEEESWMNELNHYYQVGDLPEDVNIDMLHGIIAADIMHDVNSAVTSSTSYSSSSSSGGGGGGFSGGGGGGGGGGGW